MMLKNGHIKTLRGWGCMKTFLNNRVFNGGPYFALVQPEDVMGIEIYREFKEVPKELLKGLLAVEIWGSVATGSNPSIKGFSAPCGVAIVWTSVAW